MIVGIVGAGDDKFTVDTRQHAISVIKSILIMNVVTGLTSGRSPVGGVDIWAEAMADELEIEKFIYAPKVNKWDSPTGYGFKQRNLDIARKADEMHVIVVTEYPEGFPAAEMKFKECYHCLDARPHHVKSGGCWTGIQAEKLGKPVTWHYI